MYEKKISKYNNYIIESSIYDIILEAKLNYMSDFKSDLSEILSSNEDQDISIVAQFLQSICDKDFKKNMNYIDSESEDKVSFIPDDKIKEDTRYLKLIEFVGGYQLINDHPIIKNLDIPLESLNIVTKSSLEYENITNKWILIKTIELGTIDSAYGHYKANYLENADNKGYFIIALTVRDVEPFEYYQILPSNRSSVKIGRFINKILDFWHKENPGFSRISYTPSMIEKFVNYYSSNFLYKEKIENSFKIVSGEDIRYWYLEDNYNEIRSELGNSCMRYQNCQSFLDIYVKNPEVCSLLILLDTSGKKILGRALLWKGINGDKFIDRIYTTKDSYKHMFNKWAKLNKYMNIYNINKKNKVEIKNIDYVKYPYMDSLKVLKYINDDSIHLSISSGDMDSERPYYNLESTSGSYTKYS